MTHFEKEYYLENHGHYNLEFTFDGYDAEDICVVGVVFPDTWATPEMQAAAWDFMEKNEDIIIDDFLRESYQDAQDAKGDYMYDCYKDGYE